MNRLTFSTLACPDWSIETVIANAAQFGYEGLEWRGGAAGHVQPDMPASQKALLRTMSMDKGLSALAVTTYTSFVSLDAGERHSNVEELRRYLDLAAELGAAYVRVFLGELPGEAHPDLSTYENIIACLHDAVQHARSVGVQIAIEPHDNFARSSAVAPILDQTPSDVRVIWDVGNTFAIGEEPAESFAHLQDRLAYVQVKDGIRDAQGWRLCSVGQGNVPLQQGFEMLMTNGYQGAFSVEWEYAWHPELDPPDVALPAALQVIKGLLMEVQSSLS